MNADGREERGASGTDRPPSSAVPIDVGNARDRSPAWPWWVAGLVALLALQHLRGYLGAAQFEHLAQLRHELAALAAGGWSLQIEGEPVAMTGGGSLFVWLHHALWALGRPYRDAQWLHLALEGGMLAAWLLAGRRRLPPVLLWGGAWWLALYGVPKTTLIENSALVAFTAPPLFAVLLAARVGAARVGWIVAAAVWLGLSVHLGLIALFALPAIAWALWRIGGRQAWVAAAVLAGTVGAALIPFAGGAEGESFERSRELSRQLADPLGTLAALASYTARYLTDPALLLGLLVLGMARGRALALPGVRLALIWLACTVLPVALLDQGNQCEPYHFTMASPARAWIGAVGLAAVLDGLRRRLGGGLHPTWPHALAALLALAITGAAVAAALQARAPATDLAGQHRGAAHPGGGLGHCAAWDAACDRGAIEATLAALATAGVTPAVDRRVDFHGVDEGCLDAAWEWRRSQRAATGAVHDPVQILLLGHADAMALPAFANATRAGGLLAVTGVEPLPLRFDWRTEGALHVVDVEIDGAAGERIYLAMESTFPFRPGAVSRVGAPADEAPVITRCDHTHRGGRGTTYDGYRILALAPGPGDDPLRLRIEHADDVWDTPERMRALRLPGEGD